MEEKSKQIQNYLQNKVNPIMQPMLELLAKEKPNNILQWIQLYVNKKISEQTSHDQSSSDDDDEINDEEFKKKLERIKKRGAKKNSRQAISSEVYGQFNQKQTFIPKVIQKPKQTEAEIQSVLKNSIFFQNLNQADIQTVVKATEIKQTPVGETIITQGEQGDALYIVSSGEYDCSKIINGENTYLKTYKVGEAFGELALMYNAPRAATIICKEQGVLYKLDRQTFRNIAQEAAINKRNYYRKILSSVDILTEMDIYEKDQICDALKQEQFGTDEYIVHQGDIGDKFFIIAEGELIAEKSQDNGPVQKVFDYQAGEYFGEIALMKNTVRQASIKTITPCRLIWIDRSTFKRLLGPLQGILKRNMEKYRKIVNQ